MKADSLFIVMFSALCTLYGYTATGQIRTQPFDEIRNDPNSYFYKDKYEPLMESRRNPISDSATFSFGLTKVITPKDTFVTYLRISYGLNPKNMSDVQRKYHIRYMRKDSPRGTFATCSFDAELENREDLQRNIYGTKTRGWSVNWQRIKHYRDNKHFKIKAYFPIYKPGKDSVVKCLTADVHFLPMDWDKSTVTYSVKYLKYRHRPEYGFLIPGPYGGRIGEYKNTIENDKEWLAFCKNTLKGYTKQNDQYIKSFNKGLKREAAEQNKNYVPLDREKGPYYHYVEQFRGKVEQGKQKLKSDQKALRQFKKANREALKKGKNAKAPEIKENS